MARNPPFSLDGIEPDALPELAVDIEEVTNCSCSQSNPHHEGYPAPDEVDPTMVKAYDKWNLWQCQRCGGIWWEHDWQADYGDPRMDIH